jgi:hypothetical protein
MAATVAPFHPAVGLDQQGGRQVFGEDAVLGGRIGRSAQADDGIGVQRLHAGQHGDATEDLDGIADEHHPPFGVRIGKDADKGGQQDVGNDEELLQQRHMPVRRGQFDINSAMAANSRALSANAEKNCAVKNDVESRDSFRPCMAWSCLGVPGLYHGHAGETTRKS